MSTINRDNYETFFLLYTDNELSVAERETVDEFIALNPDLEEELIMLKQTVLKADNVIFDLKSTLQKNEAFCEDVQEELLMHLDNELSKDRQYQVNSLIGSDEGIKREWAILQQTKLSPDDRMVFSGKESLYRKESGRIVALPWRRIAVAAILLGFGLWGGLNYFNSNHATKVPVTARTKDANKQGIPKPSPPSPVITQEATVQNEAIASGMAVTKKIVKEKVVQSKDKAGVRKLSPRDVQPMAVTNKTNNLPKPYFEKVNNNIGNKTITANVTPEMKRNIVVNPGNNDIATDAGKNESAGSYASTASFTDSNEDNSNDRVLYMNEEKVKRSKLGGLFRKVKRVIERSANIKPGGNNIKVANLEFAIQ